MGAPGRKKPLILAVKIFSRLTLSAFFSLRVEGRENLPDDGGFILLPKHQAWVDVPLVALACTRPLYFVAKEELFHPAPAGWFFRGLGGIPLNRARPLVSRRSLRAVDSLLARGNGIVIFPEGTYYPGRVGPGRAGMVRFVCSRSRAPFVPAGINYERGGARTVARIVFGKTLMPGDARDIPALLDEVMDRISELSGLPRVMGASS